MARFRCSSAMAMVSCEIYPQYLLFRLGEGNEDVLRSLEAGQYDERSIDTAKRALLQSM